MPRKYSTASNASTNGAGPQAQSDPKLETQAMSFADLAQFTADGTWLDLKQAAEYANRQKSTLRAAIAKLGTIFNADSLRKVEIAGTGFPPLMYVAKSALDTWVAQRASETPTRTRSYDRGRKYIVWIKDGDYTINDSFTFSKAELTVAFKPKAEKLSANADQTTPVTDEAKVSATELELELVEA